MGDLRSPGYTLIEVVIVLTVMALLTVMVMPRIVSIISPQTNSGYRDYVVGTVREGIGLQKLNNVLQTSSVGSYPSLLDNNSNGVCNTIGGCFNNVLENGQQIVDRRWGKQATRRYAFNQGGLDEIIYDYNSANGTFLESIAGGTTSGPATQIEGRRSGCSCDMD